MSKTEKFIIILAIIVVIIIVIIGILIYLNRGKMIYGIDETGDIPKYGIISEKPELTKKYNTFFTIDACIQKVISYTKENNNEAVYNILNKEYIQNNNVNTENIQNVLGINNITNYKTKEVYELLGTYYSSYYIKGITDNANIYFCINLDEKTSTFDIKLITNEEFENYINKSINEQDKLENEPTIDKNNYNSIPYKYLTEEDIALKYFNDYIDNAINFKEEAYNSLDETYRKAKFGNLESFVEYIDNNSQIKDMYTSNHTEISDYENYMEYLVSRKDVGMEKYSKEQKEGYTQYICIDSYENYYIFRETAPMQYTLILDTYTIDIPEFTEKYNAANNQEKVILNLNKFMLAINDGDYKYAYRVLADSFKTNNFPTYESFAEYIKTNFFSENKFDYVKFGDEAGTYYTYTVNITDASGTSSNTTVKTFIMLLEEGTNFELSFNV